MIAYWCVIMVIHRNMIAVWNAVFMAPEYVYPEIALQWAVENSCGHLLIKQGGWGIWFNRYNRLTDSGDCITQNEMPNTNTEIDYIAKMPKHIHVYNMLPLTLFRGLHVPYIISSKLKTILVTFLPSKVYRSPIMLPIDVENPYWRSKSRYR